MLDDKKLQGTGWQPRKQLNLSTATSYMQKGKRKADAEAGADESAASSSSSSSKSLPKKARPSLADPNDWPRPKLASELSEGEPGTRTGRPLRLYMDGIFDLFHFGHAKALQQGKEAYPNCVLLVGCCNDEMTHRLKGRTVLTDKERYESLRHCKWVDEVVEDAPWVITDDFLAKHRIDYVCHDALPYADASGASADGDVYSQLKKRGMFYETQRTEGVSTSDLIVRIIGQYDTFIRRNLARGYSASEMNVPFMKEKEVQIEMAMDKAKAKVAGAVDKMMGKAKEKAHEVEERVEREIEQVIDFWGSKAKKLHRGFLEVFDREGALRTSMREARQEVISKLHSPI